MRLLQLTLPRVVGFQARFITARLLCNALSLSSSLQRERKLLEEHAPRFLADLADSLKAMRERKQKRGAKEDEEQGDELQTEG